MLPKYPVCVQAILSLHSGLSATKVCWICVALKISECYGAQVVVSAELDTVALAVDPVRAESSPENPGAAVVSGLPPLMPCTSLLSVATPCSAGLTFQHSRHDMLMDGRG